MCLFICYNHSALFLFFTNSVICFLQKVCLYSSDNHKLKDCPNKTVECFKCANCMKSSDPMFKGADVVEHSTTHIKCSIFQQKLDKVLKKTLGSDDVSKNFT